MIPEKKRPHSINPNIMIDDTPSILDIPETIDQESSLTNYGTFHSVNTYSHSQQFLNHHLQSNRAFVLQMLLSVNSIITTITILMELAEVKPEVFNDNDPEKVMKYGEWMRLLASLLQSAVILSQLLANQKNAHQIEHLKHHFIEFMSRFFFVLATCFDLYAQTHGLTGGNSEKEENDYTPAAFMFASSLLLASLSEPKLWNKIFDRIFKNHPIAAQTAKGSVAMLGAFISTAAEIREIAMIWNALLFPTTLMSGLARTLRYSVAAAGGLTGTLHELYQFNKLPNDTQHPSPSTFDVIKNNVLSISLLMLLANHIQEASEEADPNLFAAANLALGSLCVMKLAHLTKETIQHYRLNRTHQELCPTAQADTSERTSLLSKNSTSTLSSCGSTLYYYANKAWEKLPNLPERLRHTK